MKTKRIYTIVILLSIAMFGYSQPFLTGGYQGGSHGDGGIETFLTGVEQTVSNLGELKVYPNPFTNKIQIDLSLSQPNEVRICIYDVLNKEVRLLSPSKKLQSGSFTFYWDGKNNQNAKVKKGNYYLTIDIGDRKTVKKVVYM